MRERIMSEAGYLVDSLKSTEGKAVVAKVKRRIFLLGRMMQ